MMAKVRKMKMTTKKMRPYDEPYPSTHYSHAITRTVAEVFHPEIHLGLIEAGTEPLGLVLQLFIVLLNNGLTLAPALRRRVAGVLVRRDRPYTWCELLPALACHAAIARCVAEKKVRLFSPLSKCDEPIRSNSGNAACLIASLLLAWLGCSIVCLALYSAVQLALKELAVLGAKMVL